jgi:hypothetical protein
MSGTLLYHGVSYSVKNMKLGLWEWETWIGKGSPAFSKF